jgi:transposase
MTGDTTMAKVSRIEVIATGSRRRWSAEEKQRIVAEALSAPRNVSATARRHGLSGGQVFTWCRLARAGKLAGTEPAGFAPAVIAPAHSGSSGFACGTGVMEIALASGCMIRVDATVDASALKRVLSALDGR